LCFFNTQAQTKRLRDELKRVQRRQGELDEQLTSLRSRATEIELSNKSSEDALRAVRVIRVCVVVLEPSSLLQLEGFFAIAPCWWRTAAGATAAPFALSPPLLLSRLS
jgi:hypothetical protein